VGGVIRAAALVDWGHAACVTPRNLIIKGCPMVIPHSRLSSFLRTTFPGAVASPPADCWISKFLAKDPAEFTPVSEAVAVVEKCGQLAALQQRCAAEHPTAKPHRSAYDRRLLDCLTEACAFSWADEQAQGTPEFRFDQPGEPDVRVSPDLYVEAKGVWNSDDDQQLVAYMARTNAMISGMANVNLGAIEKKFDDGWSDALRKFGRVQAQRAVVFFNLLGLDVPSIPLQEQVFAHVTRWATVRGDIPDAPRIVICRTIEWKSPLLDSASSRA
jgi:hypothetical protein